MSRVHNIYGDLFLSSFEKGLTKRINLLCSEFGVNEECLHIQTTLRMLERYI